MIDISLTKLLFIIQKLIKARSIGSEYLIIRQKKICLLTVKEEWKSIYNKFFIIIIKAL